MGVRGTRGTGDARVQVCGGYEGYKGCEECKGYEGARVRGV